MTDACVTAATSENRRACSSSSREQAALAPPDAANCVPFRPRTTRPPPPHPPSLSLLSVEREEEQQKRRKQEHKQDNRSRTWTRCLLRLRGGEAVGSGNRQVTVLSNFEPPFRLDELIRPKSRKVRTSKRRNGISFLRCTWAVQRRNDFLNPSQRSCVAFCNYIRDKGIKPTSLFEMRNRFQPTRDMAEAI